jgi:hypothetical protein
MQQQMSDFDCFYISYDEPKCEENWADLLQKAPWSKRVHGVKGFDAAHKACANQSETDRFITIDGDNIVDAKVFDMVIDIPEKYDKCSLSWNSINAVNGLIYGNGGVKLWTKDFVLGMRTHEAAETEEEKLDFCWDNQYLQLNSILSTTCPNGSPFQAFRAGFREGVKMTLDAGAKIDPVKMKNIVHNANLKRLMIWASIGADTENGLESIYGTRLGIYMANIEKGFTLSQISDYDWFTKFGQEQLAKFVSEGDMIDEIYRLGTAINRHMGLDLAYFDEDQSKFFKQVYEHPNQLYSVNLEKEIFVGYNS